MRLAVIVSMILALGATRAGASGPLAGASRTGSHAGEFVNPAAAEVPVDDNGSLTDDGSRLFFYDYKNRLVGVSDRGSGNPIATYEYLADGRRAKKVVYSQTTPGQVQKATAFFYDGAQEVEEQDAGSGATEATYVWSPVYVDELVTYTNTLGTFYTHQDARFDVVAITDGVGSVVERVRYDDFGKAEIRGPDGEVRAVSAVGNVYGFQGRRLDAETGLLYFRARYYDPETGRFLQRDPVWDAGNVGGQYTFCGNGPVSGRDAFGTQADSYWGGFFGHVGDTAASFGKGIGNAVVGAAAGVYDVLSKPFQITQKVVEAEAEFVFQIAMGNKSPFEANNDGAADLLKSAWGSTGGAGIDAAEHLAKQTKKTFVCGDPEAGGELTGNLLLMLAAGRAMPETAPSTKIVKDYGPCFLAGTLIETEHGLVPIEDIRPGDRVVSRDEFTGEQALKRVTRLFRGHTGTVAYVKVAARPPAQRGRSEHHAVGEATGEDGAEAEPDPDPIRCTIEHPFWVIGRGWVAANRLRSGDRLVGSRGEQLWVVNMEVRREEADHFNFEVEDWHSYFVAAPAGEFAVWVHNASSIKVDLKTANRTAAEAAAMREYARRSNEWLKANGPQEIKPTKGDLRSQASAAARAERAAAEAAGEPYAGQAGHVPDTAVGGNATPPAGWLDMPGVSNQAAGGTLGSRIGQIIEAYTVDGELP